MPKISNILNELWPVLEKSSGTRNLLNYEVIFGFRKPKSLQDLIVRADLSSIREKTDPPKCNRIISCRHCPFIDRTGKIISPVNGRSYKVLSKVTCNTNNLIYCLTCTICKKQYVGQTKNQLYIRVNQHRSDIRTERGTTVAIHMKNSHGVKENAPLLIHVLQLIRGEANDTQQGRNKWESIWMSRLNSYIPGGLNILE
jgi:hypothetical protein